MMTDDSSKATDPSLTRSAAHDAAEALFASRMRRTDIDGDRLFAWLMILQWVAGIVLALVLSPWTWSGDQARIHSHVWAALFIGGAISSLPLMLIWKCPGERITRHTVAIAQMLWSAFLIHLTGGRIETHFHVFVSLAFLALYRDWHVLVTATVVVAVDHFVRGIWWPQSVFGVMIQSPFRWIEHAVWVVFEDIILIRSCLQGRRKSWDEAVREVQLSIINKDLMRAHEEALAASQVKSQFLANMSHELRTPLNAIIGYSELLEILAAKRGDSAYLSDLGRVRKAGEHLLSLINDILDISKIEAGKLRLEMQTFHVSSILDDVYQTIQPLAEKNGNTFEMDVAAELGAVHADPTRLKQCLLNLLSNACKFTREGLVIFTVKPTNIGSTDGIEFRVADTGVGISEEQIAILFQPFTQADASTTRKFGGTGLGLAITKKLCESMDGSVAVASRLGEGSTFVITLPAHQPGMSGGDLGKPPVAFLDSASPELVPASA